MAFWQRKRFHFKESGNYLNKPVDNALLNIIFIAITIFIISYFSIESIFGDLLLLLLLTGYLFIVSRRKSHKKNLFINHDKLTLIESNISYYWQEFEFIFFKGEYTDNKHTEHIILSLNYTKGNKLKNFNLHFSSDEVSISALKEAIQYYCPKYQTEEVGVEKHILYDTRNAANQEDLIQRFKRLDAIAFAAVWISLAVFVGGCIWNHYSTYDYIIPSALAAAIMINSVTKETCRSLFISKASQLHLPVVEAREFLKKHALGMGYEGASGATSYYWVMALAIIGAFYINYATINP